MARLAVYAGSFDPPTSGHLWMIEQGARLFERLIVAIGTNPEKRYAYPLATRLEWLRDACRGHANVAVEHFDNMYLSHYARQVGAAFVLRGIRSEADFGYERTMRHVNADMHPGLTTVFLIPPREIAEVSSSMVKGLIGPAGWQEVVRGYVPARVFGDFLRLHGGGA